MTNKPQRVVLAMSGGVDSSVAGHLLTLQGYEVVGVFMRHGEMSPLQCDSGLDNGGGLPIVRESKGCCTARDAADAQRVADDLNIPFYPLNLKEEFQQIINYFVEDYSRGRTPNPCVMCNNILKFGKLFEYADSVGAQYVATGHYARLETTPAGGVALRRGIDGKKDQSYVLFGVEERLLPRMMLPIGQYRKSQIRSLAEEFGLGVSDKPDSQDICFVGPGQHAEFVARRSERSTRGELVTSEGRVVAEHDGIEGFTIGQRKGLGVAMGEPYFVVQIEPETNRVVIGRKEELARRKLTATKVNWLTPVDDKPFECEVQIRYNSQAEKAVVTPIGAGEIAVEFDQPCYGVAPGQAAVCYLGDRVIGGGWIQSSS